MANFFIDRDDLKRFSEGWLNGGVMLHKCGNQTAVAVKERKVFFSCGACEDQLVSAVLYGPEQDIKDSFFYVDEKKDLEGIEKLELVEGEKGAYHIMRPATPLERLNYLKNGELEMLRRAREKSK
jgi:hypothetical protein